MKMAVLAVTALALTGCDHMYGGMDAGRLTEPRAITVAKAHLAGKPDLDRQIVTAQQTDDGWRVDFASPECAAPAICTGGPTRVFLDHGAHRVVKVLIEQ